MTPMRTAVWIVWSAYGLLAMIIAALSLVVRSPRLDVGSVMGSMLGLGGAGVIVALALLAGSAIGTYAWVVNADARRIGPGLTVVSGWIGFVVLGWILWGFWTH